MIALVNGIPDFHFHMDVLAPIFYASLKSSPQTNVVQKCATMKIFDRNKRSGAKGEHVGEVLAPLDPLVGSHNKSTNSSPSQKVPKHT